jgi:hypothetical protein
MLILSGKCQIRLYPVGHGDKRCTKLMISNETMKCSKIYSLQFDVWEGFKSLKYDKDSHFKHNDLDTGKLIGVIYA